MVMKWGNKDWNSNSFYEWLPLYMLKGSKNSIVKTY